MSIRYAILGFLSWKPFTGYELKKRFADALSFHWAGTSNQVYGSLLELHKEGAVTIEVIPQEKLPARKVYTITQKGRDELKTWLLGDPDLPAFRNLQRTRLAWTANLSDDELRTILTHYAQRLSDQIILYREQLRRGEESPARSPREILIWKRLGEASLSGYESELAWIESLKTELGL